MYEEDDIVNLNTEEYTTTINDVEDSKELHHDYALCDCSFEYCNKKKQKCFLKGFNNLL